jgi:hypothetical protein
VTITGEGEIEIVVYIAMCSSQIHVELYETSCKVVGCLGTHTPAAMNCPTITIQLWAPIVNIEV